MRAKPGINSREYIETHFRDILGKVFAPYEDKGIIALALRDKPEFQQENDKLLAQLQDSFTVVECDLGTDPRPLLPPPSAVTEVAPHIRKRGVFMVMMENFAKKAPKFWETGKIAVPIRYTADGMEILSNASNIGSVLFHTRHVTGQHLYELKENVRFVPKDQIPAEYYLTVRNPSQPNPEEEVVFLYALLDIEMGSELDSSMLNSQKKPFVSAKERYDAQFALLEELVIQAP